MSEHDLQAGVRWSSELASRLSECDLGIACVTAENQASPWLMFEAGAISKSLDHSRLIPLLLDIQSAHITHPLAQFQLVTTDQNGIAKLLDTINTLSDSPLSAERMKRQLDRWWPDMERTISEAKKIGVNEPTPVDRSDKEILYEILEKVRALSISADRITFTGSSVYVDSRPFLGNKGEVIEFKNAFGMTTSAFLDKVWEHLNESGDVHTFTYNEEWVLFNDRTNKYLYTMGDDYIKSRGKRIDKLSIDNYGIWPGDRLEVHHPL